ncbi:MULTISPECIES: Ti-type conjugative transfer relaxase TraA [unclassified Shinella]|uniref:Ti-type conjugative transfer relaxase TraA n=1 Tax=unclassified Shinella TaxID=2643062 RepID=UPI00225C5660|nr:MULTISPECIES: Ti-type conjugative transfer relaxase TraA [unclassified Shinella]MDC7260393.1 Ti-type conjugative transfer relaxase TraA [Shinella sp. YE25]MDC7267245.1 Ti-type conjugative transfer relaxase TraA [Shinella sp. HY16]MDC7274136.1 Ti-type conjugative transfer relaxase TraA [Shinella sp. YZ44]CAI0335834.1 Conjugal transfer protein TraA [Rhizobiaceae bacterium]
MAIYHCSMKPIARASGRSAVAAAAYRTATKILNERDGLVHDFTRKEGVEHSEIVLPTGSDAEWARDRAALWNAAEKAEVRKDARVAREFEVALPHELSAEQRVALTRDFAQGLADRYGTAVDFAIHEPHGAGDIRNHHAHVMMTTRRVEADGLGDKTAIELKNARLLSDGQPTSMMQLREIRQSWEHHANEHLARAGIEARIDHRSHAERGLEIEPTEHMGVHASQMDRRGLAVSRTRLDAEAATRNAELIRKKPEQVLSLITNEKSVFDRHDVARALHRYIDDPDAFRNAFASVMASPALVELQPEKMDGPEGAELARYSTREMVEIEGRMAGAAERLSQSYGYGVDRAHVGQALDRQDSAIRAGVFASTAGQVERGEIGAAGLSSEQREAIGHITGPERIAAVVGLAGAGKSTMLAAAREAWERQGYRVHGAALAGKAAEGLEESSGIASRTLASWEYGWQAGKGEIGRGDVFVIDEAGMVGSRQLARFVGEAERSGAKLVLVGDHEQLQAIGAGAPFRAIAEQIGFAELQDVRRQREDWSREASVSFARHRTAEGLAAYAERGAIRFADTRENARADIVRDYMADLEQRPQASRVAMAHRRVDVRALNADIRSARQERGQLAKGEAAGEISFQTNAGKREFAAGDRIVFLQNDRELGVKNGMLGTVSHVETGRLTAELDGSRGGPGGGEIRSVSISTRDYAAFDHGYATTIHKTQGSTVDRAFVLASGTMDRHLTYVAMTRHRDSVQLHAGRDEFKDEKALSATFSRAGLKETTLDYAKAYAERRGLAEELGIRSEIEIPQARQQARQREVSSHVIETVPTRLGGGLGKQSRDQTHETASGGKVGWAGVENKAEDLPGDRQESPKRVAKFAGLRLSRGPEQGNQQRQGPDRFAGVSLPAGKGRETAEPLRSRMQDGFAVAVDRYAQALHAAERMAAKDLPILEHQKLDLQKAGAALDQERLGAVSTMRSAFRHDPEMGRAMAEFSGRERTAQLVAGIEREEGLRADPNVRAERLVQRWTELETQHKALSGWQHDAERKQVEGQMKKVAHTIGRDPQAEAAMKSQAEKLGIGRDSTLGQALQERQAAQMLEQKLSQGLRLSRGIEMER